MVTSSFVIFGGRPQCCEQRVVARQRPRRASRHPSCCGRHVEIDIPEGVAFVSAYFSVPQYPVIQDRKAAFVLVVDHAGQLWLSDYFVLQTDVLNTVRGVGITCGLDHTAVVVEREFILEPVA